MKRFAVPVISLLLFIGILFLLYNKSEFIPNLTQSEPTPSVEPSAVPDTEETKQVKTVILGEFQGTIPCADCQGIQMHLTLYQDPETTAATKFILNQTYLGKSDTAITDDGNWDYLRGNAQDPDATIYGLNLDKPEAERMYFLKDGDDKLTMLDRNMNEINSKLNYTLVRTTK